MNDISIKILGRASRIRYRQGPRSVDIDSEPLIGSPALVLYQDSIKTWHDGRAVTDSEKAEIVSNLRRMLRARWGEIDVA